MPPRSRLKWRGPTGAVTDLPLQFGTWHGEDTEMDPNIAVATGADVIVNRIYRDEAGHAISLHTATFLDPAEGVYHSPLNCYRGNGWEKISESRENVKAADDLSITVSLVKWKKEEERILVVYWYQLGQHVLYDRFDLGDPLVDAGATHLAGAGEGDGTASADGSRRHQVARPRFRSAVCPMAQPA